MSTPTDRAALATSAVVVCTEPGQQWHEVRAAIASLAAQTHRPDRIVLVVDHDAGLAVRARGFFAAFVQVVENRRTRGPAPARNSAVDVLLESADGLPEVVVFLDGDAVARPDWLARLLAPFEDATVAAVRGATRPRGAAGAGGPIVASRSMAFRRDVLVATGGFGEGARRPGGEEIELCVRMRRLLPGARVALDPDAVVEQPPRTAGPGRRFARRLTALGTAPVRGHLGTAP